MGGMRGPGMVLDPTMAPMGPGMMAGMQAMPGQMLMLAPGTSCCNRFKSQLDSVRGNSSHCMQAPQK